MEGWVSVPTPINLSDSTPAAPAGTDLNVKWQADSSIPRNVSAYVTDMVGDSGSGGTQGLVPAPPAGSAAAGKFLKADGTFAVPAGGTSSPLTTKGDIWGYDTTNDRVPVGTDGQVLTAHSAAALGVQWQTPAAGALVQLQQQVLASPAASVSFTVASGSYTDLILTVYAQSSDSGLDADAVWLNLNGDSGTTYAWQLLTSFGGASNPTGAGAGAQKAVLGAISTTGNGFTGSLEITIQYAYFKGRVMIRAKGGYLYNAPFAITDAAAQHNPTGPPAAVASIQLVLGSGSTFVAGSTFTLYART